MSEQIKRREPGKRVYPADDPPKLVLMPPTQPNRPPPKVEQSPKVKEMLREMNQRHADARNNDAPDAA
jgi:hypothetical protein